MDILDLLTRSGTYILAVAVFVLTFFTRRCVEGFWPTLKKQADANAPQITYLTIGARWWNEVVLYAVPVAYGALSACSTSSTLYGGLDGTSKVMFGASVGWFSSFLYKTLKRAIGAKLGDKEMISEVTP
jgi:hypothetical protein